MPLDTKEVQRRGEDLQKAAAAKEPASVLLPMLAELRAGVKASEDLLRSTRIGVTVNNLRKNDNLQVAKEAGDLVTKWRNEVKKGGAAGPAKKTDRSDGTGTPVTGGANVKPPPASKDSNGSAKAEDGKSSIEPEKRNSKTDEVDTQKTGNPARDACFKLMYDGLAFMQTERKLRRPFSRGSCMSNANLMVHSIFLY